MTYQEEDFIRNIIAILTDGATGINNEIAIINAERTDFAIGDLDNVLLEPVRLHAGGLERFLSIGYPESGEGSLIEDATASAAAQTINVTVAATVLDNSQGLDLTILYALLRYKTALVRLFKKNFSNPGGYGKITITQIAPTVYDNENVVYRSSGIQLSISLVE